MGGNAALRQRVAELVNEATGGYVAVADLLAGDSMVALGLDSLGLLRLVDAIELEYGVEVDLQAPGRGLDTLDDLVTLVAEATGVAAAQPVGGTVTG